MILLLKIKLMENFIPVTFKLLFLKTQWHPMFIPHHCTFSVLEYLYHCIHRPLIYSITVYDSQGQMDVLIASQHYSSASLLTLQELSTAITF